MKRIPLVLLAAALAGMMTGCAGDKLKQEVNDSEAAATDFSSVETSASVTETSALTTETSATTVAQMTELTVPINSEENNEQADAEAIRKIIAEADKLNSFNKYYDAVNTVNEGLKKYPDNGQLISKLEECRNKATSKCERSVQTKDYISALKELKAMCKACPDDKTLSAYADSHFTEWINTYCMELDTKALSGSYGESMKKITELSTEFPDEQYVSTKYGELYVKWQNQVLSAAAKAFQSEGYTAAIQVLNKHAVYVNDETLNQKIEYYKGFTPISLLDLEVYSGRPQKATELSDSLKNNYQKGFAGYSELDQGGKEEVSFYLQKAYKTFTFTVAPPYKYRNNTKSKVQLEVYADDVKIYSSGPMNGASKAQKVKLDMSNVDFLKFRWVGIAANDPRIMSDSYVDAAMATVYDPEFTKQ